MSKTRVSCFAISLDGFGAGPGQNLENPLGVGAGELHNWYRPTATFRKMFGQDGGSTGIDNDFAKRSMEDMGAWILGRNMFGPVRGDWPDENWKGWWGPNPPYHVPVYVLTHYPRKPLEMEGGTCFILSPTAFMQPLIAPGKMLAKKMCVSVAVWQRSGNTSRRICSTNYTSPFRRS
jgi:dihydrofolate reductase